MFNQKEYDRQYTIKNKEKRKIQHALWHKNNKDKIIKKRKEWIKNNPSLFKAGIKRYYKKHFEERKKYRRNRYQITRERCNKQSREWAKNNSEGRYQIQLRSWAKSGSIFNLKAMEYRMVIMAWSKLVRQRANNLCFCGDKAVCSHHILHQLKYPKISLNPNNGVALCLIHHNEAHGKNF